MHISKQVEVKLDGSRSYTITIGHDLLQDAANLLLPVLPSKRVCIVTDTNVVHAGHVETLKTALEARGISTNIIALEPGEKTKSFSQLEKLLNQLLELRIDRKFTLLALGGGVIGDLTGFAASILLRGIPFIQIPTTLLAMVDSSVGGKTGINTPSGKNLVGSFYQPLAVLADMATLSTLPRREVLAGYAEVVKYGLINQPDFFAELEESCEVLKADPLPFNQQRTQDFFQRCVEVSCQSKAEIVSQDERESGARALLNLGHTFGHALEAEMGYDNRLLHGEAVAAGMAMAFRFSCRVGLCPEDDVERVEEHLKAIGLPCRLKDIGDFSPAALLEHMRHDKKVQDGTLVFILARSIGKSFIEKGVPEKSVLEFLEEEAI